jgi:hypothetical protein
LGCIPYPFRRLAQKDWGVKVESDGKSTRLTDNAWAVQATRAAAALWLAEAR